MAKRPFTIHRVHKGQNLSPIIFDSPHSGTDLPDHFEYICTPDELNFLTDMHVEKLLRGVPATGAPVLESKIHRTCIDLNRTDAEFDPDTVREPWPTPTQITQNVLTGFGLFPKYVRHPTQKHLIDVFNDATRPTRDELNTRINQYYRPYYRALDGLLKTAHAAHGFTIHCDMHSMRRRDDHDIVLGDLHGAACAPEIIQFAEDYFNSVGLKAICNKPFAGAAIIRTTHAPDSGFHSLQIEMVRDLYMDPLTLEYKEKKAKLLQRAIINFSTALNAFARAHAAEFMPTSAPKTSPHAANNAASTSPIGTLRPNKPDNDVTP